MDSKITRLLLMVMMMMSVGDVDTATAAKYSVQFESMSVSWWNVDDDDVSYWHAKP